MSSDVIIRNAIHNAANTLGMWILASALVVSIVLPLVGWGVLYAYGQARAAEAQERMEQLRQPRP
jgi:ABC-type spermidine/putrescine transport system permease subunit I